MNATHHTRIVALDGLRAVSILLVLLSHAWLGHIVPGGLGVTIFFFISGFIITRLMITEWDEAGRISIKKFYLRRVFRLMPALVVFVMISLCVMQRAGTQWTWIELASVFFYFANYFGIFIGFSDSLLPSPLSITWSLAVEEHFYMIFPFVFLGLISVPKRFLTVIFSLVLIVLAWRVYLVYGVGLEHLVHYRIYKATDTRVDSIMYGTGFAILLARYPRAIALLQRRETLVFGVMAMLYSLISRDENFRESYRYSLQGIALACMFSYLVLKDTFASRFLSLGLLNYLGKISYSLYLYQWLVFAIITAWIPALSLSLRITIMIGVSIVLADLSYRFVERPCLNFGRKFLN
ncbi:acyltransferase family protein [Undibacterium sp. RuRC25W]|uniref:acyltransferase family protein n=1 Tax=Undibacterium sp. RuRC25W TaxID=3413047 RepID=UPI003BF0CCEB